MTTLKRRTVGKELTTSSSDVYVCPQSFRSNIESILVSNGSDASVAVTLRWYNATEDTTYDILDEVVMLPRSVLQITDPLYFYQNDKMVGLADTNSAITVSVRVEETFINNNLI